MALYDAFISYSHSKDKAIAAALQSAIQKLGKPWYRRRALRLFRDDTSLSATPHLWPSIERALGQSRFFVLLASPEAAASKWVNREVAHWLDHNSIDTLLIGVTDGELSWDDATGDHAAQANMPLPPVLASRFPDEPKWVDLRAYRDGADKGDAKFTELAADFAAAIRGMPKEDLLSQEVRQQRRALRLALSSAAALLVLAVAATAAGVLAYREEQDAVAQRNRAEQTLAAATKTANGLVFDLAEKFRYTVGIPATLVKDILDRARALQEELTKSGELTPDLKQSESAALMETADSLLAIGDTAGAGAVAEQAQQIDTELLAGNPGNPHLQRNLAASNERVGDVLDAEGKLDEALAIYRKSLAIWQVLAEDRSNPESQRSLAISYEKIGGVLEWQGKHEEALTFYQQDLAVELKLAESNPNNTDLLGNLVESYRMIGQILQERQGKRQEALVAYQQGLAVAQKLVDSDSGNALWQRDLALMYGKIGSVLASGGKREEALAAYQQGLVIAQKLADSDPRNVIWQHDLGLYNNGIGYVLASEGKFEEALAYHQKMLAIEQKLVDSDPGDARKQRDLSISYNRIGFLQIKIGKLDEALAAYQKAVAIRQTLADGAPNNPQTQSDLSVAYAGMGSALDAQGKLEEAVVAYQKGLTIEQKLVDGDPANMEWLLNLAINYDWLGRVLEKQSKLADALTAYRDGLADIERLVAADPSNIDWQRRQSISYNNVGNMLKAQDNLDDALKAYRNGLAISERFAAVDPNNKRWQDDLQYSIGRVGGIARNCILARKFGAALEAADQAISLAPGQMWLYLNRAAALMFLDRVDEASALYLQYRGEKNVDGAKSWETVVLEDFAELRKAGLSHPLMDKIENKFSTSG